MIDASEGLGTPREAFCRIVEVRHLENPDLGKEVTGPWWHYQFPRDSRDALAVGNALGFLAENVSAGKISAQGIRKGTEHVGPKPINTAELRTGILKVWDGTLECRPRLYQQVFLSMADLNRVLGVAEPSSPLGKEDAVRRAVAACYPRGIPADVQNGAVCRALEEWVQPNLPNMPKISDTTYLRVAGRKKESAKRAK